MKITKLGTFRIVLLVVTDYAALFLAGILSIFLTEGRAGNFATYIPVLLCYNLFKVLICLLFGVYKLSLRNCSIDLLIRGLCLVVCDIVFFVGISFKIGFSMMPVRLAINLSCWSYLLVVGYRVMYRLICEFITKLGTGDLPTAIIYGAGECGRALCRFAESGKLPYAIIGFVDDKKELQNRIILNKQVLGNIDNLPQIIGKYQPKCLIIAIPSGISGEKMQEVAGLCRKDTVEVKIAPSMFELETQGHMNVLDLRSLNYADMLGRPLISIDRKPIADMVQEKRVLVTGAGGSIGSEICRQLVTFHPSQLLLLDIDETELHNLSLELTSYQSEFNKLVFPICCDIKNKEKIDKVFSTFRPQIVFHAAAYKHVPMMELYPEEAIKTNIGGSYNVLKAAQKYEAERVIVISTDKAVNPTNIMGATKRVVELEAALLTNERTAMVCVRFGNVLGSRGSMLPLFFDQIKAGVPITVTDRNIIRYFMAIPEAVGLVFLAGAIGKSGEVMALDMGEPVKIYDFAQKLIDIFGDKDKNKIVITGLRPGEKLYEELLADKDRTIPTDHQRIFKAAVSGGLDEEKFTAELSAINSTDVEILIQKLQKLVPEFQRKQSPIWENFSLVKEQEKAL